MFSFDRLKYSKIPIWENKCRIEYLTLFRELTLFSQGVQPSPNSPLISRLTSGSINQLQARTEVNERIPRARQIIELSEIKLRRNCSCTDPKRPPILEIDLLEQIFGLTRLGVSSATVTETPVASIRTGFNGVDFLSREGIRVRVRDRSYQGPFRSSPVLIVQRAKGSSR